VIEEEHHGHIQRLKEILESHDEKAIHAVSHNIDIIHERLKRGMKKQH
jgi:hypothetical protein